MLVSAYHAFLVDARRVRNDVLEVPVPDHCEHEHHGPNPGDPSQRPRPAPAGIDSVVHDSDKVRRDPAGNDSPEDETLLERQRPEVLTEPMVELRHHATQGRNSRRRTGRKKKSQQQTPNEVKIGKCERPRQMQESEKDCCSRGTSEQRWRRLALYFVFSPVDRRLLTSLSPVLTSLWIFAAESST